MRKFNFCAGPATIPLNVLEQAQSELLNWHDLGASVMEISHRSEDFEALLQICEADLRTLLSIPKNYHVLFLQGGAYAQFDLVPMNLLGHNNSADYIDTGIWSAKAAAIAQKHAKVNLIYSGKESGYHRVPQLEELVINEKSAYVHFCANETVNGVEFPYDFEESPIPVVADMSSNILSRRIDVCKYGLIYAGAQKNIGPAGVTLVIVREDLLDQSFSYVPDVLNYKLQVANGSMLNTPPTFAIYLMSLILKNLLTRGGVEAMEKLNQQKAAALYNVIDNSELYSNRVAVNSRSNMNIPFSLKDSDLDSRFLQEAYENNLINLKGHRSVGGMRASLYNAMSFEGVTALVEFMQRFESKHL